MHVGCACLTSSLDCAEEDQPLFFIFLNKIYPRCKIPCRSYKNDSRKNELNRGLLEIFKVKRAAKAYSVESFQSDREPLPKKGGLALISIY